MSALGIARRRTGSPKTGAKLSADQGLLLGISAAMLLLIVVVSLLAPESAQNDPRPTTYNTGPQGAKAAFLTLQRLGVPVSRWERPIGALSAVDARRTTLVLAEPLYAATDQNELAAEVKQFLEHGGRVLATGPAGAQLLPGGSTNPAGLLQPGLCTTTPEGPGPLARAGRIEMSNQGQWGSDAPKFRVAQRCGADAVVVRYAEGAGEAVWWSSATPLTNVGLKQNPDLRLLLASLGVGRGVVFDESLHKQTESMWDEAKGLPLGWLSLQAAVLFVLLMLSFSRRRGPVREPVALPRSSPLEFAESMGDLYEKGGATSAATEAARRRLLRVLTREAGLAQATVDRGPAAIAEALHERLGGDWSPLAEHLRAAEAARQTEVSAHSALTLVQVLAANSETVRKAAAPLRRRAQPTATTIAEIDGEAEINEELEFAATRERE